MILIDMARARDIHLSRLRAARAPMLEKLDVDFMRAVEGGDQAALARIAQEKQRLRDVTVDPRINEAATPEQLRAVWPL